MAFGSEKWVLIVFIFSEICSLSILYWDEMQAGQFTNLLFWLKNGSLFFFTKIEKQVLQRILISLVGTDVNVRE